MFNLRLQPILSSLLVNLWILSGFGCGGDMKVAPVSGTVTLDGAPLPKASIMFEPTNGGRPSYGVSDDQGQYQLDYSLELAGAEVGECKVSISTAATDETTGKTGKDLVPKRYKDTPLKFNVEAKSNTINIDLKSSE